MQIVVDNILTNYEIVGDQKKKPLLILHGWQRSSDEWLPIAKNLEKAYQSILLDLPGFGKTTKPTSDFSVYDYAKFVEHFLDKLGLKKITFLGHSLGARIGIILSSNTNIIEKLVLISPAGIEKKTIFDKIKICFFKAGKIFLPKNITERLKQRIGSADYKNASEMRSIFLKIVNEDLSYLLPKINIPTLLIWGDKDTEVPMWKIRHMKQAIQNSRIKVIWGAGHFLHVNNRKEFINILKDNL
jgi:pimeloyl-ACP methyl ester carboxylesterase